MDLCRRMATWYVLLDFGCHPAGGVLAGRIWLRGSTCLEGRVSGVHIALAPLDVHIMTCNELFSHFTHSFDIIVI
jgi:hypothetical protein